MSNTCTRVSGTSDEMEGGVTLVVMQERRGEPKRAVRASLPTL
jgi:hypothetical protein